MNLIKVSEMLPVITTINSKFKNNSIDKTAAIVVEELSSFESSLFSEEGAETDKIFNLKLFDGYLNMNKLKTQEATIKYMRLIYVYSVGCKDEKKGNNMLVQYKRFLKNKNLIMDIDTVQLQKATSNLPPNLKDLVSDLVVELGPEMKNINPENLDLSNPMASLMGSGLNISNLFTNVIPKLQTKIDTMDPDTLSKEIATLLSSMKKGGK